MNKSYGKRLNLESAKIRETIQLILKKLNIVKRIFGKSIWKNSLTNK